MAKFAEKLARIEKSGQDESLLDDALHHAQLLERLGLVQLNHVCRDSSYVSYLLVVCTVAKLEEGLEL